MDHIKEIVSHGTFQKFKFKFNQVQIRVCPEIEIRMNPFTYEIQ